MTCLDMQKWKASEWNDSPVVKKRSVSNTLSAGEIASLMHVSSFLISGETRETRWLNWSSSIRRYSMNELGSSVASSHTLLWNAPIFCLLAIQPLTQTRRFLLLMRAFPSPSKSINARTPKAFFFAKRRNFGLRDVNVMAWELDNRWSSSARNVARNVATV